MLYPLKFKPLYKDYVWGGRNLASLGKILPETGIVAESWEVACHKNGSSIIANREYEGISLPELIEKLGRKLIGNSLAQKDVDKFPLLIKFIDAENNLSVQVHPDDAYAYERENGEYGKNEMWYIVSAKPGAKLVYDVEPGITRENFAQAISENKVEQCLKSIEVFAGDVINIPAGLVHAIGQGIMLAEVQQNSDTTYRVYDYGRVGRPLHIEKALEVIDFNSAGRKDKYRGLEIKLSSSCTKRIVVANQYFCTEVYNIAGNIAENANGDKFFIYTFTSGAGSISWGRETGSTAKPNSGKSVAAEPGELPASSEGLSAKAGKMSVKAGESVLIPAALGAYTIEGELTALKAYIPDLKADVIEPLKTSGWTTDQIASEVGGMDQYQD